MLTACSALSPFAPLPLFSWGVVCLQPDALYHMGAQYVQSLSNLDAITAASLTVRDYILSKAYRGVPIMVTYSPVHMQGIYPPADGRINCAAFKTPASESQLEHMAKVSESIAIRDSQVAVSAPLAWLHLEDSSSVPADSPLLPSSLQNVDRLAGSNECMVVMGFLSLL